MRECFWYFLGIALVLLIVAKYSLQNLLRGKTKVNLFQFIASIGILLFVVLDYFNLLNLDFLGGKTVKVIFIVIFFLVMYSLMFSDNIQRFFNRRRMKGKERTLSIIENSLLSYCLAKHDSHNIHYYYELGYQPLDNDAINEILSAINAELSKNGTGLDNQPNEHGLQLEYLINEITEKYLSPESE